MNDYAAQNTTLALTQQAASSVDKKATAIKRAVSEKDLEKIERTAQDFEAMFVAEMMKPMFEGIETDGMFGGGKGEEIFRGLMLQEYGKMMAETGQLGIADHVKAQMIQIQEEAQNP